MLPAGTVAPADLFRYLKHQRITVIDLTPRTGTSCSRSLAGMTSGCGASG